MSNNIGALLWGVASAEMLATQARLHADLTTLTRAQLEQMLADGVRVGEVHAELVVRHSIPDPERRVTAAELAELDRMQWQC